MIRRDELGVPRGYRIGLVLACVTTIPLATAVADCCQSHGPAGRAGKALRGLRNASFAVSGVPEPRVDLQQVRQELPAPLADRSDIGTIKPRLAITEWTCALRPVRRPTSLAR